VARPTKLNPAVSERIVQALRAGNYAEAACRAAGIGPSTYYRWLELGQSEDSGPHRDFLEQVRRAEAEAEVHAVALLRRAMPEDWRAALAYLERRHPTRWRRRQSTELTGPDGGPIRTEQGEAPDLSLLTEAELKTLEEVLGRASQPD